MILGNDNLSRCARHPSQLFTGFCPSCLVERLSNVGTAEQSVEAPRNIQREIVKVPDVGPNVKNKTSEAGTRKTLQYLFQLDDDLDANRTTRSVPENNLSSTSNACESEISSHDGNFSKDANIKINSYGGTRMMENDSNSSEEITISTFIAKEISESAERQKGQGKTLWFNTMFAKKRVLWRTGSISKKFEIPDDKSMYLSGDKNSESYLNLWQSCDWRLCHNSSKNSSWEPPRHSWDGSMLTRALSCSFSCLEEGGGDLTRTEAVMQGEITGNHNQNVDKIDRFTVTANVPMADEKPISSETLFVERLYEESQPGDAVSTIRRKKSHRLSKVWDWNIGNSFRDLVKKCDHILERSASETINGQKSNNVENMETNGVSLNNGDCQGSVRMNQGASPSMNAGNADMKNMRSEWRMKNGFKLGRSRSVHYPSPGNLDYGLLRFYLTPLRSSRRCANRVRRKKTHYFGRGIFGLS